MARGRKRGITATGGFEQRMLARIEGSFPERYAALGKSAARALIRAGTTRAAAYGLLSEQEVCRYIDLLLSFGPEIDAAGGRVAAALSDAALATGSLRLDRAFERAWRDRLAAAKALARQDFSAQPALLEPEVRGAALSFTWEQTLKLARGRATVTGPHWQAGQNLKDGSGSTRPAAIQVAANGASGRATLTLRLDACSGIDGRLEVSARLGALRFTGSCPARVGEHVVALEYGPLRGRLQRAQGNAVWRLSAAQLPAPVALAKPTRLEWYALLGPPAACFEPAGVWVEALRFLFEQVGVGGLARADEVVDTVVRYCHGGHGVRYDSFHGAPSYGCSGTGGAFQLGAYLTAAKPVVNCYDQAAATQALCGALGVATKWLFLRPYGFIHTTDLVGVGPCNNPFFSNHGTSPTVGSNDRQRSAFANHAFAELGGAVVDACAGPHTGAEDRAQYVSAAIDAGTTLYRNYSNFRPGSAADIIQPAGVTKVV